MEETTPQMPNPTDTANTPDPSPASNNAPEAESIEAQQVQSLSQEGTEPSTPATEATAEAATGSAPEPASAPPRKSRKPIAIVCGVVIVAAVLVGGFFALNIQENETIRSTAEEALASPDVTEAITVPSQWGEFTGFQFANAQERSLDHDIFGSPNEAEVVLSAEFDSEALQLDRDYLVSMAKTDGVWQPMKLEVMREVPTPLAGIPGEMVLANLGTIIAKSDEQTNTVYRGYNTELASLFGEGTTAQVLNDRYEGLEDSKTLELTVERDGQTYTGELTADFAWLATEDGFDWMLTGATPDENTYLAVGSIPHEGPYTYATAEGREEWENTQPSYDEYYSGITTRLEFNRGNDYAFLVFENIPNNNVDLQCTITLDETGEVLYESPRLAPGMSIDTLRLNRELTPGEYAATAIIKAYDTGSDWRVSYSRDESHPVTIIVQ